VKKNHGLLLAVVVAYGMYKEYASKPLVRAAFGIEELDEPFQLLSFHDFGDQLSAPQGLGYSPVHKYYPGDSAMRVVTRLTISQQKQLSKNKQEGARKPGRPKKDKEEQEQDRRGEGCHTKPIKIGKEVHSQVAPVCQFDCDQPSHQGTNANEA
jgi:hypothetical protein